MHSKHLYLKLDLCRFNWAIPRSSIPEAPYFSTHGTRRAHIINVCIKYHSPSVNLIIMTLPGIKPAKFGYKLKNGRGGRGH